MQTWICKTVTRDESVNSLPPSELTGSAARFLFLRNNAMETKIIHAQAGFPGAQALVRGLGLTPAAATS